MTTFEAEPQPRQTEKAPLPRLEAVGAKLYKHYKARIAVLVSTNPESDTKVYTDIDDADSQIPFAD